ncbi:MAG TPA: hemerythrin domain-containing protein [Candidatus Limnocylindrales bacterium]|nr:hemerythrin domain-containing protein [Candidatus Limnocylindrales bacterium]
MTTKAGGSQAVWAFTEHEHRDLVRGINRIHDVACEIGRRPKLELSVDLLNILAWLDRTLGPHIAWEEGWLYPEIDGRLGTPWATRAARYDHQQIRVMAARLRADHHLLSSRESGDPQVETRCHLYSLEALLRAHIEREERFLIPLLDDERATAPSGEPAEPIGTPG